MIAGELAVTHDALHKVLHEECHLAVSTELLVKCWFLSTNSLDRANTRDFWLFVGIEGAFRSFRFLHIIGIIATREGKSIHRRGDNLLLILLGLFNDTVRINNLFCATLAFLNFLRFDNILHLSLFQYGKEWTFTHIFFILTLAFKLH